MQISFRVSVIKPDEESGRKAPEPEKLLEEKKGVLANAQVTKIDGPEYQGVQMNITAKAPALKDLIVDDAQNIVPYIDSAGQYYYIFKNKSDKKKENKQQPDLKDPQMDKMFKALFSSARYRIYMQGSFVPAGAVFVGSDGEKITMTVEKFAGGFLLDIPLILMVKEGALVVSSKSTPDTSLASKNLAKWFPAPPPEKKKPEVKKTESERSRI